jgi:tetratricopeptide (TPR) repeat protein
LGPDYAADGADDLIDRRRDRGVGASGSLDRPAVVEETDDRPAAEAVKPVAPTAEQVRIAREKREAEHALQQLLDHQTVLEAQQVRIWGGADYETALTRLAEGDAEFANQNFAAAAATYQAVTTMLVTLEASKADRLTAALEQGVQALQTYDAKSAQKHFTIALAIDPQHVQARRGAARAKTLDRLASLLASGREHEQNRKWTLAEERFRAAQDLDPDSRDAREAVERVTAIIKQLEFRGAMSDVLTAIETGALSEARRALERARMLNPESAEVADAQLRLTRAIQAQEIALHRSRAQQGEREEHWQDVIAEYRAVLVIDPHAQFALQGLQHAERLAKLYAQLDAYLDAPGRLQSREPRTNADHLLQSVTSLSDKGPKLRNKLDALEDLVRLASTPVAVLIRSDNQTEVSIDRVGRIGRFSESRMMLLPGTYRVRGMRVGYRDVRLEWTVTAGPALQTIEVRCEEQI